MGRNSTYRCLQPGAAPVVGANAFCRVNSAAFVVLRHDNRHVEVDECALGCAVWEVNEEDGVDVDVAVKRSAFEVQSLVRWRIKTEVQRAIVGVQRMLIPLIASSMAVAR